MISHLCVSVFLFEKRGSQCTGTELRGLLCELNELQERHLQPVPKQACNEWSLLLSSKHLTTYERKIKEKDLSRVSLNNSSL